MNFATLSRSFLAPLFAVGIALLYCYWNNASSASVANELPPGNYFWPYFIGAFLSLPLMCFPILFGCFKEGRARLRQWFSWSRELSCGRLLLCFIGMALATEGLLRVVAPKVDQLQIQFLTQMSLGELFWMALPIVVFIPIVEECLFRGILLEAFPVKVALPLSAALFAIAHGLNVYCFGLFFLGIVFGLVALKTRSLLPSILLHGVFNALSLLFM